MTRRDELEVVERYVVATFARYERAAVALIPTLEEPRVADLDLALKRLCFFVETLAGFAVGAAVGAVARTARRGFGEEARTQVGRLVSRVAQGGSQAAPRELGPSARFLSVPGRPLLEATGAQLLARLHRALPETRSHVADVYAEVARTVPARRLAFAGLLERLAADDAAALAFSDQLAAGWRHYTTLVSERRAARSLAVDEGPEGPWRAWTHRLDDRSIARTLTQDEIVAEGFLLRIA